MSETNGAAPKPEQRPPGRFKQSHLDSTEAVDDWLKGNRRIVVPGISLIVMVLGSIYFGFFV